MKERALAVTTEGSILGNAVLRREDPNLLEGSELYLDDIPAEGMAYVHFVRSTIAHAAIAEIDISDAEGMPGVLGVFAASNTEFPALPFGFGHPGFGRPLLAGERVRQVGDIVAAIVAETRGQAADAAEAVFVDYDELPVVLDMETAGAEGTELLFPETGTNVCFHTELGDEDPLVGADHVTELKIESQRLAGVPIEPNGTLAIPGDDSLMVWTPSQNPQAIAGPLSQLIGMEMPNLRVATPKAMGGGFGPKAGLYPETVIVSLLAMQLDKPLKWAETRSENMVSMFQGRAMTLDAKMGFSSDGRITGLDVNVIADCGCYPNIGAILTTFTQTMIQGVYDVPKLRYSADSVVTNTTPIGAYRGAGRPEATQMLERILDIAAQELSIDPAEIRKANFIAPEAFPFTTHSGANYDNGEYAAALDTALETAGYGELRAEQEARRASGADKQLGIGLSTYVEVTAPAGLWVEYGKVEITDEGKVIARVGTSSHGQGHITAFSMIISDKLGVPMEDITVLQSDTGEVPKGAGTMGSRSLQTAGSAVFVASETVFEKAQQLAGHLLEAAPEDIVKAEGGLQVAGVPANTISWAELYAASNDDARRPADMEAGLEFELDFDGSDSTFPFGAHVSVVEVDMATGGVEMIRHVAVDDAGRILNPMLVSGQQHGGIAQGAAQALFEGVQYDEYGNPVTSNLADYAIPAASEFISFEAQNSETPTFRNPLGAKGIGESGTIGSTPAIHNAVLDALAPNGVRHIDMPLSPRKVWAAINN
jgi:carbon-monoxide dehydrogenase large subunit